jgi:putative sterol carrier protein
MTAKEFLMGLPKKVSPEAIEGHNTTFQFDLSGEDGGQYTLAIKDGKANVVEGLEGDPNCVVRAKGTDLMDIVEGRQNPMMAFMMGKIKVTNQGEMLKYAKILGLM